MADTRDTKRPRGAEPAVSPAVSPWMHHSLAQVDAQNLGWPQRGHVDQDHATAAADAAGLDWPQVEHSARPDEGAPCMPEHPISEMDHEPVAELELCGDEESFGSLHEGGSWYQGRGGGNPHPEMARAGGSAARISALC